MTALHTASWHGYEELVHNLLMFNADPAIADEVFSSIIQNPIAFAQNTNIVPCTFL